jgi:hypothetical protein
MFRASFVGIVLCMNTDNLCHFDVNHGDLRTDRHRFTEPGRVDQALDPTGAQSDFMAGLDNWQVEFLATAWSHFFRNEQSFTYILPDEHTRRLVLPWFFRTIALRARQTFGGIYTTQAADGAAIWINPGCGLSLEQMMRTGLRTVPFELERATVKRCMTLTAHVEAAHKWLVRGPHWHLAALGVEPSTRAGTIRKALIEPGLSCADSTGLPCYLETFDEINLPFYEEYGFRVEGAGRIQRHGPNFWAMVRNACV